jgi:hypothetical protein
LSGQVNLPLWWYSLGMAHLSLHFGRRSCLTFEGSRHSDGKPHLIAIFRRVLGH